jgi:divalent metal cation (Fe/Co/Zn/Cd) transporter
VAGPGSQIDRADRLGTGQRRGGPGQRDRDLWRFTGTRVLSGTAERRAQRAVAVSFWLLAPYIAAESIRDLVTGHHSGTTVTGMALTAVAVAVMPLLGCAKHKLAARLGSAATAGEGTQNYLCAAQAAAVLAVLAIIAAWPGGWRIDPVIGLGIAAVAVREGIRSWHGDDCC